MKRTRNVLMLAALVSISILMSCGGGGGGPGKTDGEKLIDALVNGTWVVNEGSTSVSGVTGTFDVGTFAISFSETSSGVSFSLSGDVATYLSGGSFAVSDDADISSVVVNAVGADLAVTTSNFSVNSAQDQVTVSVTVSEAARVVGIGTYTLVYDL